MLNVESMELFELSTDKTSRRATIVPQLADIATRLDNPPRVDTWGNDPPSSDEKSTAYLPSRPACSGDEPVLVVGTSAADAKQLSSGPYIGHRSLENPDEGVARMQRGLTPEQLQVAGKADDGGAGSARCTISHNKESP